MTQMEIHVHPFYMTGSERKILKGMDQYFNLGCGLGLCPKIDLYKDTSQTVRKSNCFVETEKRTRMI